MVVFGELEEKIKTVQKAYCPEVIIVVGSVGKSSTKHAISRVLSEKYKVNQNPGDANGGDELRISYFGICLRELNYPLTIAGRIYFEYVNLLIKWRTHRYPYEIMVLEMSETEYVKDRAELDRFLKILQPELCIFTGVSGAHMSRMGTRNSIVNSLQHFASYATSIIYNGDDEQLVSFGKLPNVYGSYTTRRLVDEFLLHGASTASLAAALKVAEYFGLSNTEARSRLRTIKPLPGRMHVMRGKHGSIVIDDTFNASTEAFIQGLKYVDGYAEDHYKVVVLGGINELGKYAVSEHRKVATVACQVADLVICIGNQSKLYFDSLRDDEGCRTKWFKNSKEAGVYIKTRCQPNWLVYAKGSQNGIFTEEAIKPILSIRDSRKLPRQSMYWMSRKKRFFTDASSSL